MPIKPAVSSLHDILNKRRYDASNPEDQEGKDFGFSLAELDQLVGCSRAELIEGLEQIGAFELTPGRWCSLTPASEYEIMLDCITTLKAERFLLCLSFSLEFFLSLRSPKFS